MRITIIPILTVYLITFSCSQNKISKVEFYGQIDESNSNEIVKVEPSQFQSFDNLVERVEQVICNDSIPAISIKENGVEKIVRIANPCWEGVACILIKRRNILKIEDEKIKMEFPVSLDSLETYISNHYNNNGKSYRFSESANRAIISISFREKDMENLRSILSKIIKFHTSLNLNLPLVVHLDVIIPPPPLPHRDDL
jgi:hypothetical protein